MQEQSEDLLNEGLWSIRDAAVFLGVSRPKVYKLLREGELPWVDLCGVKRIPIKSVKEWLGRRLSFEFRSHSG